jgi:hypothetical protein
VAAITFILFIASHACSKARKLPMHYYDEWDADEDAEEEYSARSDNVSNNNYEEGSEAGAGKFHGTSFVVYSFLSRISCFILKMHCAYYFFCKFLNVT